MNISLQWRRSVTTGALIAALTAGSAYFAACADDRLAGTPVGSPSRIVLTWADDPARTQAVTWRMAGLVAHPQAQIAPLTPSPKFEDSTVTVMGTVTAGEPGGGPASYAAEFKGLKPGTKYTYRVGDGATWSEWNVFQTASTTPEPFRFIYVGDAQNNIRSLWSRTVRTAFATAPDARFIISAGDLVAEGYDDRLWGEWCEALGFISAMIPSMPVPGNHDLHQVKKPADDDDQDDNPLTAPAAWRRQFDLPRNGPAALQGQSYYVDFQGARFIALDVNAFGGTAEPGSAKGRIADQEVAWLDKVLSENRNRWTVVFSHYPVYPVAKRRTRFLQMESRLVPLYDKYHVDLVLQGHDHGYGRTYKLRGGKPVAPEEPGTIYAVSVSGTKMYEIGPPVPEVMAKTLGGVQLFQVVSVSPDRLALLAYTIDGAVIDSFEIRK